MLFKKFSFLISTLLIVSFFLSACGPQPPSPSNGVDTTEAVEDIESEEEEGEEVAAPTENAPVEQGVPDLSGESITIYHIGDLTGPTAWIETPGIRGVEDMVAAINDSGGVFGAQLDLVFLDSEGVVENAVMAFEMIVVEDDNPLAILLHSNQENLTISHRANDEHIPIFGGFAAEGEQDEEDNYVFGIGVPYPQQFAHFLSFLVSNWADIRPEGAGEVIKVAYISWSNEFGQAALTEDVREFVGDLGLEIVYEGYFSASPASDLTNQILDARKAEANVIYTNTYGHGPAILLNDLHRMGLAQEFIVAGPALAMDSSTYAYLEKPEYFDGFFSPFYSGWWSDERSAAVQIAINNINKNQRSVAAQKLNYLLLHGGVDILRYGIEQAILEVGFEDLTGEAIYNALSDMENYNVLSDLMIVDFSDGKRSLQQLHIRWVEGMMLFVPVQDWADLIELP